VAESELTTLQTILNNALDDLGVTHDDEHFIWAGGHKYKLDAYLPDYYAYIEADGPGIHHSRRKDGERDVNLKRVGLFGLHLPLAYLTTTDKNEILKTIRAFVIAAALTADARRKERGNDAFAGFTTD
jgi:hypothetical protein